MKFPQAQVMYTVAGTWWVIRTEVRRGSGAVRIQEGGPGTFAGSKGGDSRQSSYRHPASRDAQAAGQGQGESPVRQERQAQASAVRALVCVRHRECREERAQAQTMSNLCTASPAPGNPPLR